MTAAPDHDKPMTLSPDTRATAVDSRIALKPCPFCGAGETLIKPATYWTGRQSVVLSVSVQHWCDKGDQQFNSILTIKRKTEAEAIAAWNARPSETARAEHTAEVRKVVEDHCADLSRCVVIFAENNMLPTARQMKLAKDELEAVLAKEPK